MIWSALVSEILKYRRSAMLGLVAGTPTVLAILQLINFLMRREFYEQQGAWNWITVQRNAFTLWGLFLLPLLAVVLATLAARLEHERDSWQYMLALPLRWELFYLAKLAFLLILIQVSITILVIEIILEGMLLGIPGEIPWLSIFISGSYGVVAAWPILALHLWVATRNQSFAVSMGLGVIGIVIGVIATVSEFGRFVPWAYPIFVYNSTFEHMQLQVLLAATVVGVALSAVSLLHFVRSDAPGIA